MQSLSDLCGIVLSVLVGGALLVAPGWTLAGIFHFRPRSGGDSDQNRGLTAIVLGLAVLPLLDSLAIRATGLAGALIVNLGLCVYACAEVALARPLRLPKPPPLVWLLMLGWLAIVLCESIDLEVAGRLYQPFTVIDMVKHAAITQAIVDTGAPPHDPFFLRPERVGYYYYFYSLAALIQRGGSGLIDARAAVCGLVFWTGLGLHGLLKLTIEACGEPYRKGGALLMIVIMAAGGLDILAVLRMGLMQGIWPADPVGWNEQITGWVESLLWVPHHVMGLIAAAIGLMALGKVCGEDCKYAPRLVVLAGLCFASAFGLSVWVSLVLAGTIAVWCLFLAVERRWRTLILVLSAAFAATILSGPQVLDLLAGRVSGDSPVTFTVRAFSPVEAMHLHGISLVLARLVALPLNYFVAFGALASGAILFWSRRQGEPLFQTDFGRLLAIASGVGLVAGAFLKSTMINNDLGWRVTLFPLLAGTAWTIIAIERLAAANQGSVSRAMPPQLKTMLVLGWVTTLYGLVSLRAYPLLPVEPMHRFMAAHPQTEAASKVAYAWADEHIEPRAVLQHNPARPRAFAFALYGHHPVAASDSFAAIFGADPKSVDLRIGSLAPIFYRRLLADEVRSILRANNVDYAVVTQDDPVWKDAGSFVWKATPVYASNAVRIFAREALGRGLHHPSDASAFLEQK